MVEFFGSLLSFLWPIVLIMFGGVALSLPLALSPKTRGFVGVVMYVSSIVLGITTWIWGLAWTLILWGGWAVIVGLFLFGVGVVPMAIIATGMAGLWFVFWQMVVTIIVLFGARWFGHWLAEQAP